jgi:hypothetical protein
MHDRFCPARSIAALAAAIALAVLAAPVTAVAAPAVSAAHTPAGSSSAQAALIVPQSAETILGEIQQQLAMVMGKPEPPVEHVEALSRALLAAHSSTRETGGVRDRAEVGAIAASVAAVIARGSLPGELLERLAQNLYASVSPRKLAPQEASLLALDVALLLQESGGTAEDVVSVLKPMQRLCPGVTLPNGGQLPKTASASAHRPAPRVLSVLARPSSGS